MFLYDKRKTKFMNLVFTDRGNTQKAWWTGRVDGKDTILRVSLRVKSETKVITRTRRKFWDDVSLRGG